MVWKGESGARRQGRALLTTVWVKERGARIGKRWSQVEPAGLADGWGVGEQERKA